MDTKTLPLEQLQQVASKATLGLNGDTSLYSFEVIAQGSHQDASSQSALTVTLNLDEKESSLAIYPLSMNSSLAITYGTAQQRLEELLAETIVRKVQEIFQDEQAAIAYLLRDTSFGAASKNFQIKPETSQAIEKRTTRAFKYASEYHVTFSLFAASASPSAWDIKEAVQQYIEPLLRRLSPVSKFHVDTQVQLFASFSPSIAGPQLDEASDTYKDRKSVV